MELTNTFVIPQPTDRAWEVITDIERIAPCLPGAVLLAVEDGNYRGAVKVKVGPVTAQYDGVARFAERDDGARHAVLRAEGRDARGQGSAAATIDLSLLSQGTGTEVRVSTDLQLTGRVAQFGRGVIADVSSRLIGQFADALEREMSGTDELGQVRTATESLTGAQTAPARSADVRDSVPAGRPLDDVQPLDLMRVGGTAALKRVAPTAAVALGLVLGWLLGRRGRTGSPEHGPIRLVLTIVPTINTNLENASR